MTVRDITLNITRKPIENLHLTVHPPDGEVRISAPLRLDDEAVRLFAVSKLHWIKKHQAQFQTQERQSPREFVSGESHYYQGRRYLLNVIYGKHSPQIKIRHNTHLDLYVRDGSDQSKRRQVLEGWYRQQLGAAIPSLIAKWEAIIGVEVKEWRIKRMKTKWGTCNIQAQRIWLNLELAKKSPQCLEYVVVHEMTHLLERLHNERFTANMDRFLPYWRTIKQELNRSSLSGGIQRD